METKRCKVLVIGAGPGGYVAAIRSGQLGMDTIIVEGERAGGEGVLQVGSVQRMEALIEVYESDISRVFLGQNVSLTSENGGFSGRLKGRVNQISPRVSQRVVLATDPTGDADARIVEVRVILDPSSALLVHRFTGMKVIARFQPL